MLVGEENVGKTSLTRFLLSDTLIDSAVPNVSTNGISISEWSGTNELRRSWRAFCPACFEYYDMATAGMFCRDYLCACYSNACVFLYVSLGLMLWHLGQTGDNRYAFGCALFIPCLDMSGILCVPSVNSAGYVLGECY